jgi:flagellar motor switch protein FliG
VTAQARPAGPKQAALVLLGLDEGIAAAVMRHLDERDLRRLAEIAAALDPISADELGPALEEFERRMRDVLPPGGGRTQIRRLCAQALGDDRAERIFAVGRAAVEPIEAIRSARTATLAELLAEEQPQLAAVVISQLPRDQAARVLGAMPADEQADLLLRIASLEEIPAQAVKVASEALAKTLAAQGGLSDGQERRAFDGVAFVAGVLNELPSGDSERLLGALDEGPSTLAPKIREAMFTFEDLGRLAARSLPVLMKEVQSEQLLIALKTASEELREHFLRAVSSRAAATMRDDLAMLPPMKLADVERAQREIAECALRLASEGRLVLPTGGGEKLV